VTAAIQNPSNRNRLVLFGALGVLLLLVAVVLPRVLSGGGGGDELGPPPDASASSGSTTTTAAPVDELAAAAAPEAFSTKNPFTPLVDSAPAATTTDPGAVTDGTGATGEATDVPADTTGTGTGGTGTGGTGTGGTEPDRAEASFSLVDVYAGPDGAAVATVEVDGSMYTVAEGETFAGGYTVVSLSIENKTGVFTSPTGGGTFSPSTGESVLK
jgi:hypothetical protein